MPTFEVEGLEQYMNTLQTLSQKELKNILGAMLYDGAGIIADEIRKGVNALPVEEDGAFGSSKHPMRGVTRAQKKGLQDSLGVAKMRVKGDEYNISIGFDGYNSWKTRKYPKGQPNSLIARSIEKGTSFRSPHPIVEPALRRVQSKCVEAMQKQFDEQINNLFK